MSKKTIKERLEENKRRIEEIRKANREGRHIVRLYQSKIESTAISYGIESSVVKPFTANPRDTKVTLRLDRPKAKVPAKDLRRSHEAIETKRAGRAPE